MTHVTMKSGVVGMIRWMMGRAMIPADLMLLVEVFSRAWLGVRSDGAITTAVLTVIIDQSPFNQAGPRR